MPSKTIRTMVAESQELEGEEQIIFLKGRGWFLSGNSPTQTEVGTLN